MCVCESAGVVCNGCTGAALASEINVHSYRFVTVQPHSWADVVGWPDTGLMRG